VTPPVGPCKLCGVVVPLQESHIVPRWMYVRLSRLNSSSVGTNPVQVGDGRAMLDPTQLTDFLLCRACEERFEPWERYLSEISLQEDDRFPGLAQLVGEGTNGRLVSADASRLDCVALAKLAVSITWRASVSEKVRDVRLGDFEASIAEYLRTDGARLPEHTRVLVWFTPPMVGRGRIARSVSYPYTRRVDGLFRLHGFFTFGMWFATCVSRNLPRWTEACCIETGRRAFISDGRERLQGAAELFAENPAKGKLARPGVLEAFARIARGEN
jgi:hypothetical protein